MVLGDGSMFDTVKLHGEEIEQLKLADTRHDERLRAIEHNYTNLENTILKGNRDTQSFFQDLLGKQWELISAKGKYDDAQSQRDYDLRKTKIERYSEMILKFAGAGGILYLVIQSILQMIK